MAKTLYSQSGKVEYGIKKYTVDTEADKEALNLRTTKMGSKCYVIDTKKWYILNSSNQWVPFVGEGGSGRSPFNIKGSVPTVTDLPTEDNAIGDLYIVQEDYSEWVWLTNSEEPNGYWEQLGANITPGSIGAEPKKLIVTITGSGGTYSADKTLAELNAARTAGKSIVFAYANFEAPAVYLNNDSYIATFTDLDDSGMKASVTSIIYNVLFGVYVVQDGPFADSPIYITCTMTSQTGGTWSGATFAELQAACDSGRPCLATVTDIGQMAAFLQPSSLSTVITSPIITPTGFVGAAMFDSDGSFFIRIYDYVLHEDVPTIISNYNLANAADVYTKTEVDQKLVGAMNYKGTKATVSALPTSGNETGDVWHITTDGSEWAWNGSVWEELGSAVDLSGYRTASAQDAIDAAQDSTIAAKYTKPSGGIPKSDLSTAVQTSLGKADTALQSVPSTYRTAAAQDVIDATLIPKPANPATGAFLTFNGSAWVAQTLSTWQGGSY